MIKSSEDEYWQYSPIDAMNDPGGHGVQTVAPVKNAWQFKITRLPKNTFTENQFLWECELLVSNGTCNQSAAQIPDQLEGLDFDRTQYYESKHTAVAQLKDWIPPRA